jgi:cell division septum initiation protein DivIVA
VSIVKEVTEEAKAKLQGAYEETKGVKASLEESLDENKRLRDQIKELQATPVVADTSGEMAAMAKELAEVKAKGAAVVAAQEAQNEGMLKLIRSRCTPVPGLG